MNISKRILSSSLAQLQKNVSSSSSTYKNIKSITTSSTTIYNSNNNNNNNEFKRNFFTVIKQYQLGVAFNLGKFSGVKHPGFRLLLPFFQEMTLVDMRVVNQRLERQEIVTLDNVTLQVDAVVYYRVSDPAKVVCNITDHDGYLRDLATAKVREVLSQHTLREVLHNPMKFSTEIFQSIKETTESWGITVENLNLKDIIMDEKTADAVAKLVYAQYLVDSAKIFEKSPISLRLRELDVLQLIAKEPSKSLVFVPNNMLSATANSNGTDLINFANTSSKLLEDNTEIKKKEESKSESATVN
eukprot:gene1484-1871_t